MEDGFLVYNGGEWYDLVKAAETFVWMQYQHIEPPSTPDPCYETPPPLYCTACPKTRGELGVGRGLPGRKDRSLKGMQIDFDT